MDWTNIADRFLNPFRGPFHLTLDDHVALARAPKLPAAHLPAMQPQPGGTTVRYEAYAVPESDGRADHMFAHYDDGRTQYIYRGGDDVPWLHAQLDPAERSPDYGKGERVLGKDFIPGQTAGEAVGAARLHAQLNNDAHRVYGYGVSNSNSLIGDFTQGQYGHRVGDGRTWGYRDVLPTRLPPGVDPVPPGMYRPENPIW